MSDILYSSITANTQVTTQRCHLIGIETENHSDQLVYDEGDNSQTAARLVNHIEASTYWKYNNIIFPLPGIKCDNGIYVINSGGTGTIYYYTGELEGEGRHVCGPEKGILYSAITADTQITTQDCWLVGGDVNAGTIIVYDEDDATNTATSKVFTMKIGSYRHYNRIILQEPIKCQGLYALATDASGAGTVYYYLD